MPLYFLKPVVWNTKGYKEPSGEKVTSGYPAEHGFGKQPLADYAGDIFVFMNASHQRGQYLVGIAGGEVRLTQS